MNLHEYEKTDWKKVRAIIEAHLASLRNECQKVVEKEEGIETQFYDRDAKYGSTLHEGVWAEFDVWFMPIRDNRLLVKDEIPHRYEKLNADELERVGGILKKLVDLFPGLEFKLSENYCGLLKYKIGPKILPQKEKASGKPRVQISKSRRFEEQLYQLKYRCPSLAIEWEDDHPKIAQELGITLEELQEHLRKRTN